MQESILLPIALPSVSGKKVIAAFDGGAITSDGGVALLMQAERRLGLADKLAAVIDDPRDQDLITHTLQDMLRARMFAIACGYEDANDLSHLRSDPAFKLACGRLPETGDDLCSQPTMSRLENLPTQREIRALLGVMVDLYCASYRVAPKAVTLDIDDTVDVVYGKQQLALFNAFEDEYCFKPIHVYDTATSRPVLVLLRPGQTPSGREVRAVLYLLIKRIRTHWPKTAITIRGDAHYGRPEAMEWCEKNQVSYVFGIAGNDVLSTHVAAPARAVAASYASVLARTGEQAGKVRGYAEFRYAAKSWTKERRIVARIEASSMGVDIRYVATNMSRPTSEEIYATLYCARGQMENLIKLHKAQLKSDRTSCSAPLANQMRLLLHTAAYWLMLEVRDAIPKSHALARAEFNTVRLRLLKIGARIIETAARVKIAFAAACPNAALFSALARALAPKLNPAPA
ncbi:MAG: IS1380 family transposase [Candidatus Binatia bacterium]